jgi:hypothetical protein
MRPPKVHGVIRRRLLVNFRVDPAVVAALLPAPFRPKRHDGWAVAGICLIRLEEIRPKGFPRLAGLSSENAAHRIAVEWDEGGTTREGVYIPRRDTGSLGNHPVFDSLETASGFFEPGSVGFSATASGRRLDQVVLTTHGWSVAPLDIEHVTSSWFADPVRFPPDSTVFDCALIMRNVAHEWREGDSLHL